MRALRALDAGCGVFSILFTHSNRLRKRFFNFASDFESSDKSRAAVAAQAIML
jgi:hypothetical protein